MDKSKTILIVVNSISGGGAENAMRLVSKNLRSNGYDVHLCALNKGFETNVELNSQCIHILNREWKSGPIETFLNLIEFCSLLRKTKPKVLIVNCELPELFVAFSAPIKSRIICVEHTSRPWNGRKKMGILVRRILKLRDVEWVTVSSNKESIWLGSKFPRYIANPVSRTGTENSRVCDDPHLTFIGRLRPEKRPEWVIQAGIANSTKVELFGDGVLREELESTYSYFGGTVKFHGYVVDPWALTCKNSIVVVPSEYEGDGLVVAEAILRGHPVLLMDNDDLRKFQLPNVNYFKDQNELNEKIGEWQRSKGTGFSIPDEYVDSLRTTRGVDSITEQWTELLSAHHETNN
jgi:glycosyltransferase involved in cell wall biosynthesis